MLDNATLPSLPHVLLEIYDALASEVSGMDLVIRVMETDAGLTARTLRLANSAYYGLSREISTVSESILRIGAFDLWWILFTTEVKDLFFGIDKQLIDMNGFWRHSLYVACASRKLSELHRVGRPEELFVAGLLHDVGKLLLLQRMPVEYREVLLQVEAGGGPLIKVERELLGFSHTNAGAALLDRWQLPALFGRCAEEHHDGFSRLSEGGLVWIADRLAHQELGGEDVDLPSQFHDPDLLSKVNRLYERLVDLII